MENPYIKTNGSNEWQTTLVYTQAGAATFPWDPAGVRGIESDPNKEVRGERLVGT